MSFCGSMVRLDVGWIVHMRPWASPGRRYEHAWLCLVTVIEAKIVLARSRGFLIRLFTRAHGAILEEKLHREILLCDMERSKSCGEYWGVARRACWSC